MIEQLFRRWKDTVDAFSSACEVEDRAEQARMAAWDAKNEAAQRLKKAIGDRRVLMGSEVVWVENDPDFEGLVQVRRMRVETLAEAAEAPCR